MSNASDDEPVVRPCKSWHAEQPHKLKMQEECLRKQLQHIWGSAGSVAYMLRSDGWRQANNLQFQKEDAAKQHHQDAQSMLTLAQVAARQVIHKGALGGLKQPSN